MPCFTIDKQIVNDFLPKTWNSYLRAVIEDLGTLKLTKRWYFNYYY